MDIEPKHLENSCCEGKSAGPWQAEPPRRSRRVEWLMALAERLGATKYHSPHVSGDGGSDPFAKTHYEYEQADHYIAKMERQGVDIRCFSGKNILDLGCGWGGNMIRLSERVNAASISGFDLEGLYQPEVPLAYAKDRGIENCFFTTGVAERIPFADDSFDFVLTHDVLEHVLDPEKAVDECYRVLKPGGQLIAIFPSFKGMFAHHLDRAVTLPGMHYLASMKTWAAGLNHLLLQGDERFVFLPFDEVVPTRYRPEGVTRNLNGVDYSAFRRYTRANEFETLALQLVPADTARASRRWKAEVYSALFKVPVFTEFLSEYIYYRAQKVMRCN